MVETTSWGRWQYARTQSSSIYRQSDRVLVDRPVMWKISTVSYQLSAISELYLDVVATSHHKLVHRFAPREPHMAVLNFRLNPLYFLHKRNVYRLSAKA